MQCGQVHNKPQAPAGHSGTVSPKHDIMNTKIIK